MTNEIETMEMLNVTADCRKKNCGLMKNSPECKLAYFHANCPKSALKDNRKTKDELIMEIHKHSDRYGDKFIEFMDMYGLINLQQATKHQLQEYIDNYITNKGVER